MLLKQPKKKKSTIFFFLNKFHEFQKSQNLSKVFAHHNQIKTKIFKDRNAEYETGETHEWNSSRCWDFRLRDESD